MYNLRRGSLLLQALVLALVLIACGRGTQPPSVARVELTPSAALLTGAGDDITFSARALDARGNILEVPIRWESSDPAAVTVDANGLAVAAAALGSSRIVATAGGVDSDPALALVADPVDGAVLVSDSQVAAGPELVAAGADGHVGAELAYTLTGVQAPEVGAIMLASESAQLAGRVVSSQPEGEGVRVVLEVVPGTELFDAISFEQAFDLAAIEPVLEDLPGSASVLRGGDETRITYAPLSGVSLQANSFSCDGTAGTMIDVNTFKLEQSVTGEVVTTYKAADDVVEQAGIVLKGKVGLKASGGLFLKAGLKGEASCSVQIGTLPLPISGALSVLIRPAVALDGEVKINASITAVTLEAGVVGDVGVSTDFGFAYSGATASKASDFRFINSVTPVFDVEAKYKAPMVTDARLDGDIYVGPVLSLRAQGLSLGYVSLLDVSLIEGRFGLFGELSLAHAIPQAKDTAYASKYALDLRGELSLGDGVKRTLEALGASDYLGSEFKVAVPAATLASSPTGTMAPDRSQAMPGDEVLFSVQLDNSSIPGFGPNVRALDLYWFQDGRDPQKLGTMEQLGSNYYEYLWKVPVSASGDYHFVAFADTVLAPDIPLEIAADSRKTVTIGGVCMPFPEEPSDPGDPSDPTDPTDPGDPEEPGGDGNPCTGSSFQEDSWHVEDHYSDGQPKFISEGTSTLSGTGFEFVYDPEDSSEQFDSYTAVALTVSYVKQEVLTYYGANGEMGYVCTTVTTFEKSFDDPSGSLGFVSVARRDDEFSGIQKGSYFGVVGTDGGDHYASVDQQCSGPLKDMVVPSEPTVPFGAAVLNVPFPGSPYWDAYGPFIIGGDGSMRASVDSSFGDPGCGIFQYHVNEWSCHDEWDLMLPGAGGLTMSDH